jgi:hypothetical protein
MNEVPCQLSSNIEESTGRQKIAVIDYLRNSRAVDRTFVDVTSFGVTTAMQARPFRGRRQMICNAVCRCSIFTLLDIGGMCGQFNRRGGTTTSRL